MVEILNVNFLDAYQHDHLVVDFRINVPENQEFPLRVRIEDPFFGSDFFIGPTTLHCVSGVHYWASFRVKDIMADPILGFKGGFILIFESATDGTEIYRRKFTFGGPDYTLRNLSASFPYDQPRLFMVGDSHTWTNFGQYHEKIESCGKFVLARHVIYKVSSFSFWSGDYDGFLSLLPIEPGDAILFSFGTYDFRKGCFRLAKKRGIPVQEIVYQTLFQTFYKLRLLREKFPIHPFIVSSVVPPLRLDSLQPDQQVEYCDNSSDAERLAVYKTYHEFWTRQSKFLENTSFLDWTEKYKDAEGFCLPELMRPNDMHIFNFRPALECLKLHLNSLE
jgi:hypothetical protein